MSFTRKAVNFDLLTSELRKEFGAGYRKVYRQIESYFEKLGFSHEQGSGYISIDKMSNLELMRIVEDFARENLWLNKCIKAVRGTVIEDEIDLKQTIDDATVSLDINPTNTKSA